MSENIKTNERELAGKIAQWFNEHLKNGNVLKKERQQKKILTADNADTRG